MTVKEAPFNTKLIVRSFKNDEVRDLSDIESRLMHLGFMDGESIKISKKAPFSRGPLLVEVRGRSVALTLDEASLINVEVCK